MLQQAPKWLKHQCLGADVCTIQILGQLWVIFEVLVPTAVFLLIRCRNSGALPVMEGMVTTYICIYIYRCTYIDMYIYS